VWIEASVIGGAGSLTDIVARTHEVTSWWTSCIEVALLAELLEAVVRKLLVCADWRLQLCHRPTVKLVNLVC
jgi:hypothetical protein